MTQTSDDYRGFTITPVLNPDGVVNHYVVRATFDNRVWFPAQTPEEARKLIYSWWDHPEKEDGET
jgi:hypothetical protein